MKTATIFLKSGGALICAATLALAAQLPTAAQIVPPGFKVVSENTYGEAYLFRATKPNDACPKPHSDPQLTAEGGWQPNPMASQTLEMLAAQPEDPASETGGIRTEPAGKERYKGGVLVWRKTTIHWIGLGTGPDMVLISGAWTGAAPGRLFGAGVSNFCGTKDAARGFIDGMVSKLAAVK
jgi:hypothetical protein